MKSCIIIQRMRGWHLMLTVALVLSFAMWASANGEEVELPEMVELRQLKEKEDTVGLTEDERTRLQRLATWLMERFLEADKADFILEGIVMGEDGVPLEDVRVDISRRTGLGPERSRYERETQIVNGRFEISAEGHDSVTLYFKKDGYYDEQFHVGWRGGREDEVLSGKDIVRKKVEDRNIRVLMERRGDITQLITYNSALSGPLAFKIETAIPTGAVLSFEREMWEKRRRGSGHLRLTPVMNLLDSESLPLHCVYILADTNDDGRIASVPFPRPGWHGREDRFPQRLRLIMNDPEGGFILFDPEDGQPAIWQMKRAPDDGYKTELVFSANDLHALHGFAAQYFYFKVNGMYGKGQIGGAELVEGGYGVRLAISFQLQMDGTRNVDTGRR